MCGITGWFNWKKPLSRAEAERTLEAMLVPVVHRGPDEKGIYCAEGRGSSHAAIGMRRLSVIDLSTGSQPIHNEDKTVWVVCNGEIYNYKELRRGLEERGHRFYTNSDVEVIVHLYEEKKFELLSALRGMYAFAVWDAKEDRLFLGRDRVGKKPLVYTIKDGALIFASEIKSILEYPGVTREVDLDAIDLYLTYQYIPAPYTAFKGVQKLPPAHYLVCDSSGTITTRRYWDIDFTKKLDLSGAEWEERILDKLREATRIRMMSDVPLGAFLSGGIDSSAVVAMMARESSRPVKTFSIGFEEQDFSELKYARLAAKHIGTDHHEFIVKPQTADILPKLAWHYGEPYADSSALPSYYVAHETRKHVTVALNGDGGDENFAGYLRYKAFKLSGMLSPLGRPLAYAAAPVALTLKRLTSGKARKLFHRAHFVASALEESPARRNIRWHCIFDNARKTAIYSDDMISRFKGIDRYDYLEKTFNEAPCNDDIDRLLYTDIMTYLPECLLVKVDIATMANSLEGRSPFLDHELMDLAAQIPSSLKLRGLTNKYILKKALSKLLPKEILHREKMGFGIPINQWFRGELKGYLKDIVLSERALSRGYFKKEAIENLIREHNDGLFDHGYRLWSLMMLELWHREFMS